MIKNNKNENVILPTAQSEIADGRMPGSESRSEDKAEAARTIGLSVKQFQESEIADGNRLALLSRQKLKAFTLAEILITLTIIGVVAAVTVPTLTKKTGNQEYVSRLQKVYSTLSQATDEIIMTKGSPTVWGTSVTSIYDAYKEHIRISKDCGSASGCWKQASGAGTAKRLDGKTDFTDDWDSNANFRKFIMADGTSFLLVFKSADCSSDETSNYGTKDKCAGMWVDINGTKKPNTFGRDIFAFALKKDGLYPAGLDIADIETRCKSGTANDEGCSGRIITEGEMNY